MDSIDELPSDGDIGVQTEAVANSTPTVSRKNMVLDIISSKKFLTSAVVLASIVVIMYLAFYVRSGTLGIESVLEADPWWFYRHAQEIIDNNMQLPSWDGLSHFPPGRPYEAFQGWAYMIAFLYQVLNAIAGFTLTQTAQWSTPIVAAATVIPAFLLGRKLSNKWGGLCTALFVVLSPALLSASVAGYCDTDMIVAFFTFLSVYSIFVAMERKPSVKAIPYYLFAIVSNVLFAWTWGFGWIIMLLFSAFMVALLAFRVIEQIFHNRKIKIDMVDVLSEKRVIVPLLIVIVIANIIGSLFGLGNLLETSGLGVNFTRGNAALVNISVAELQNVDIFSLDGWIGSSGVVSRVGLAPVLFMFMLVPVVFYKLYKKEKIAPKEIFMLMWLFITAFLIQYGIRFSILYSAAAALAAGYFIVDLTGRLNKKILKVTFLGFTALLVLFFISDALATGYAASNMSISQNWYDAMDWISEETADDSLIVTWWDPGHMLAGYTGRRVMADGAHCAQGEGGCIPYGHDIRIQDMGEIFSTSDEEEAIEILEKYVQISDDQCDEVIDTYGDMFPEELCDPVSEMYVLASSDLIQKYYWLTYYGTGEGRTYWQVYLTNYDSENAVLEYADGDISVVYHDDNLVPVLNMPEYGVTNMVVSDITYFENNEQVRLHFNNTDAYDGMVWVDSGYTTAFFMDGQTRDSLFNRMFFFNGEGLENFELVYNNAEIVIFKVVW